MSIQTLQVCWLHIATTETCKKFVEGGSSALSTLLGLAPPAIARALGGRQFSEQCGPVSSISTSEWHRSALFNNSTQRLINAAGAAISGVLGPQIAERHRRSASYGASPGRHNRGLGSTVWGYTVPSASY